MFFYIKNKFYNDLIYDYSLIMSWFNLPNRYVFILFFCFMFLKLLLSGLGVSLLVEINFYGLSESNITLIASFITLIIVLSSLYSVKERVKNDLTNNIYIFGIPNKSLRIYHVIFLETLINLFKHIPEIIIILYTMSMFNINYITIFLFTAINCLICLLTITLYRDKYKEIHGSQRAKKNIFLVSYIFKNSILIIITYYIYGVIKGFFGVLKLSLNNGLLYQNTSITRNFELFIENTFLGYYSSIINLVNNYLDNYSYILFALSLIMFLMIVIYNTKLQDILDKHNYLYKPSKPKKALLNLWRKILNKFNSDTLLNSQLDIISNNEQLLESDYYSYILSTSSILSTWITVLIIKDINNDVYTLLVLMFSFILIFFNIASDTQIILNPLFRFEDDKKSIIHYKLSPYGIMDLNNTKKHLLFIINIVPLSIVFIIYFTLSLLFIGSWIINIITIFLLSLCLFWNFYFVIDLHQALMPYLFSKKVSQYGISDEYQIIMSIYENKMYFKFTSFWRKAIFLPYVTLLLLVFLEVLNIDWVIGISIIFGIYLFLITIFYQKERKKMLRKGRLLFEKINF